MKTTRLRCFVIKQKDMKKLFVLFATVLATTLLMAEKFQGINNQGMMQRYSGTGTIFEVYQEGDFIVVKMANEYRSYEPDTIEERIPVSDRNFFLRYLEVGDEVDLCRCEDIFSVKRIRIGGVSHPNFITIERMQCNATVVRIKGGAVVLDNGLIIPNPKKNHQVGDLVLFKESAFYTGIAKEVKRVR